jgi:hypothetical protein
VLQTKAQKPESKRGVSVCGQTARQVTDPSQGGDGEIPTQTVGLKCGRGVTPELSSIRAVPCMPDEQQFRFAISPVVQEGNARRLVDILAQSFSSGGTSEDLRREFERITSLKRQSFYDALAYCKHRQWITGGGKGVPYCLSDDGSWKPPPVSTGEITGVPLSRDQLEYLSDTRAQQVEELQGELERLRDWSTSGDANGANVALTSLVRIVADSAASTRQRIRASAAVLGYKTEGDTAEFAKKYLTSVCGDTGIAFDYRIEAGELLRKHEAPRVVSETIKPTYREEAPKEPGESIRDTVARRRARADQMELEAIERLRHIPSEQPQLLALLASRNGNGGDEPSDASGS